MSEATSRSLHHSAPVRNDGDAGKSPAVTIDLHAVALAVSQNPRNSCREERVINIGQ